MNEENKFELYQKMMMLSLDEPSAIFDVCVRVIITMCKLNDDSEEEFEKTLNDIKKTYTALGDTHEIILKALALKKVMEL